MLMLVSFNWFCIRMLSGVLRVVLLQVVMLFQDIICVVCDVLCRLMVQVQQGVEISVEEMFWRMCLVISSVRLIFGGSGRMIVRVVSRLLLVSMVSLVMIVCLVLWVLVSRLVSGCDSRVVRYCVLIIRLIMVLLNFRVLRIWLGNMVRGSLLVMQEVKLKQMIEMIDRLEGSDWLWVFIRCCFEWMGVWIGLVVGSGIGCGVG